MGLVCFTQRLSKRCGDYGTKNSTRFIFFFAPIMRYLMTVVFSVVKEVRNEKRLVDSEYIIS